MPTLVRNRPRVQTRAIDSTQGYSTNTECAREKEGGRWGVERRQQARAEERSSRALPRDFVRDSVGKRAFARGITETHVRARVCARARARERERERERVTLAISAKETQMRRTAQRLPPSPLPPPHPKQPRSRAPLCARANTRSHKQTNADTLSDRIDRCIK